MNVALVYDRVNKWGGAERVLLTLHEMFPEAPLYTAVYNSETARWAKVFPKVIPSFLQNFPAARSRHDLYPWLMPLAFETLDLTGFNLVISVTSEAAKGVIIKPEARHICYCLTPTRYLWSGYDFYFRNPTLKAISTPVVNYLRRWDRIAAQRPDVMVGISKAVVGRIKKYYRRKAEVIYPPVEVEKFRSPVTPPRRERACHQSPAAGYFLIVSRLVPYKKVDLAVKVFNRLKWPLVVVGTGSEEGRLKRMAKNNIQFMGEVDEKTLRALYQGARALIFPQEEDFGITVVEAQAAGKPVIAYRGGGALETVIEGKTGIFFNRQTEKSLEDALKTFSEEDFRSEDCAQNAENFNKEKFVREFGKLIPHLSSPG